MAKDASVRGIRDIAADAVESNPGDRDAAVEAFTVEVLGEPSLLHSAIRFLARHEVNEIYSALHFRRASREVVAQAQRVRERLGGILASWHLGSGLLLGSATRVEIAQEIKFLKQTRRGIDVRIRFLSAIQKRLSDDAARVETVMSEEETVRLWEEAEAGVPEVKR